MRILGVHGVGNPNPGWLLEALAGQAAKHEMSSPFIREDLILRGILYPRARDQSNSKEIVEVNWSDLGRPLRGPVGILRHLLLLVSSMLTVPLNQCPPKEPGRNLLRTYRAAFEGFVFWSLLVPVVTMLLVTANDGTKTAVVTAAGVGTIAFLALTFGRFSPWYKIGYGWAVCMLGVGLIVWLEPSQSVADIMTGASATLYLFAQITLAILLLLNALFLIGRRSDLTMEQRLSHFALLYMPFALLSGVAALVWSASLQPAKTMRSFFDEGRFEQWGAVFVRALHYDLGSVEFVFTWAIGLMGGLMLALAVWYAIRRLNEREGGLQPRRAAQDGMALLVFVMPLVLAAAGGYFLFSLITTTTQTIVLSRNGTAVLDIYLVSARRIIPFLGFLVGPLTTVADVLGEIVFFLAIGALSIRSEAVDRVANALDYLHRAGPDKPLVIFCHSQGSVLVRVALGRFSEFTAKLVTVGSPIDSLYGRFVGWRPGVPVPRGVEWINAYRTGDYIGGPIGEATRNCVLGKGGHTGYWMDPHAWHLVEGT